MKFKKGKLSLDKEERERAEEIEEAFDLDEEVSAYNIIDGNTVKFAFCKLSELLAQREGFWKPLPLFGLLSVGGELLFLRKKPLLFSIDDLGVRYEERGGLLFPFPEFAHFPVFPLEEAKEGVYKDIWLSLSLQREDVSVNSLEIFCSDRECALAFVSSTTLDKETLLEQMSFALEHYRVEEAVFLSREEGLRRAEEILSAFVPSLSKDIEEFFEVSTRGEG